MSYAAGIVAIAKSWKISQLAWLTAPGLPYTDHNTELPPVAGLGKK